MGGRVALRDVTTSTCARGDVVALLGRNGAGKTTLLRVLGGLLDPRRAAGSTRTAAVAYVPQDPNALLFAPTVRREVQETLRLLGRPDDGAVDRWLDALGTHPPRRPPPAQPRGRRAATGRDRRGRRRRCRPCSCSTSRPAAWTRRRVARSNDAIATHAATGGAVVLATHDVELAARCATHGGRARRRRRRGRGPARDVLAGSLFAPQVLRVLPPFLTVDEVADAMERA